MQQIEIQPVEFIEDLLNFEERSAYLKAVTTLADTIIKYYGKDSLCFKQDAVLQLKDKSTDIKK